MKIFVLTPYYPSLDERNDTKVVHYFTKAWKEAGQDIMVVNISLNGINSLAKNILQGRKFFKPYKYIIDSIQVLHSECQMLYPHINHMFRWQQKRVAKLIKNNLGDYEPDVIIVHFPACFGYLPFLLDYKCPKIAIQHNIDNFELIRWKKVLKQPLKMYQGIGYRSQAIQKRYSIIENDRPYEFMAYSGVPDELVPSSAEIMEKQQKNFHNPIRLIFVGELIKLKKVDVILRALASLKNDIEFTFTIVGDGNERDSLKQLTNSLGLRKNVFFKGKVAREKVFIEMQKADIFVMVSSPETLGLVYLEAMTQGCLVIGSKGEGIEGIIEDNVNGFLVEPNDVDSLSNIIKLIYKMDVHVRGKILNNSLNTIKDMSNSKMAQKYLDSVIEIVNRY